MKLIEYLVPTTLMVLTVFFAAIVVLEGLGESPSPQITIPCKIIEIYDGDTATVEVTLRARVRLLDCWAPELRDVGGKESRDNLKPYEGRQGMLQIPLEGTDRLDGIFSFGRVLGSIYVGETSLSEEQVSKGFATKEKNR